MGNLIAILAGKKTYIIVLATIANAIMAFVNGDIVLQDLVKEILIASGFATLRMGIKTDTGR